MSRLYPKSFHRLILIGFGLVVLPLLMAMGYAALTAQRLADESRIAVTQATIAARASRELVEVLTNMERVVRQYLVVQDERLIADYRKMHGEFVSVTADFGALTLTGDLGATLARIRNREHALFQKMDLANEGQLNVADADELVALGASARQIVTAGARLADEKVARLQSIALEARNNLFWQLLAALPVTAAIAFWFRLVVARQIAQVDRAIRAIGRAEYSDGITVSGTQDLAYLGKRLDWLRRRLAELEEQKSRFLRHVSHDLKTPLTAIREASQLLRDGVSGSLNDQQKTIVDILVQNGKRLQRQIEELLNYQQASFSFSTIDPQPFAFDALVTKMLRTHRVSLAARDLRVERTLTPVMLEGDQEKLRVVLDNLLTNAIKFSPPGGTISVSVRTNERHMILDVIDQGPGVSQEDRGRIFEPFFRGTQPRVEEGVKGSGLGLAIAKEHVLAHHGHIELVVGKQREGGHFRVILPLESKKVV